MPLLRWMKTARPGHDFPDFEEAARLVKAAEPEWQPHFTIAVSLNGEAPDRVAQLPDVTRPGIPPCQKAPGISPVNGQIAAKLQASLVYTVVTSRDDRVFRMEAPGVETA